MRRDGAGRDHVQKTAAADVLLEDQWGTEAFPVPDLTEKEAIYHAAYQIDCIISIYELLLEMSRRMSKETLEAAIAFPDILEFIYEEWMGYKDSYAEELQFCLNQELGKIRTEYRNMKEENER